MSDLRVRSTWTTEGPHLDVVGDVEHAGNAMCRNADDFQPGDMVFIHGWTPREPPDSRSLPPRVKLVRALRLSA